MRLGSDYVSSQSMFEEIIYLKYSVIIKIGCKR